MWRLRPTKNMQNLQIKPSKNYEYYTSCKDFIYWRLLTHFFLRKSWKGSRLPPINNKYNIFDTKQKGPKTLVSNTRLRWPRNYQLRQTFDTIEPPTFDSLVSQIPDLISSKYSKDGDFKNKTRKTKEKHSQELIKIFINLYMCVRSGYITLGTLEEKYRNWCFL